MLLPPFEMALRAGARSVMNSYTDLDGVPIAADVTILTDLLRGTYGFDGTVVSDYFAVAFLRDAARRRRTAPVKRPVWRSRPGSTSSCPL